MSEIISNNNCDIMSSSPDQSPQLPWPMVPVLQTLTVLSDGEEEQMEQKMGIENGFGLSVTKLDIGSSVASQQQQQQQHQSQIQHNSNNNNATNQKRKVGRPITSVKTMNRSFPAVDEIRAKLEAGECYVRPRASSSSSDVWALFQEVAYKDNHFFTGIVQCKTCHFLTRYHGQITGTSHMRRHHCFSLLFPNSTPANRKPKNNQTNNGTNNVTPFIQKSSNRSSPIITANNNNSIGFNMISDADSTTPRMLKKIKKEIIPNSVSVNQTFKNEFQQSTESSLNNLNNITIHPAIPKKKFKNGNGLIHHLPNPLHERSLISSVIHSNGNASTSQSMLRSTNSSSNVNGYNSPSSSSNASSPSSHHHSSSSSSSPNATTNTPSINVPTTTINNQQTNLRIQNSKQDLRERLIQFCSEQLIPLKSVSSNESFRQILQSHLRLCSAQMLQFLQQQPQLINVATSISNCLNHSATQLPDSEQLQSQLELMYKQCGDKIRQDVNTNLENNVGSALICDSDQDACIISVYYVDSDWKLTEAILSTSTSVYDINRFVSRTLETYHLQDRKKLSKFTFVSHGGLFGGVSVCLSSMAHIVDKIVDESLSTMTEESSCSQGDSMINLNEIFDSCHEVITRLNIPIDQTSIHQTYDVDWISKYELMRTILSQQDLIRNSDLIQDSVSIDFNFLQMIVKLLEPFRTASHELRQCFNHPTLCHVLLYFHKLKKVLSNNNVPHNHQNHHSQVFKNNKQVIKSSENHKEKSEDSDSNEEKDIDDDNDGAGDNNSDDDNNTANGDELETTNKEDKEDDDDNNDINEDDNENETNNYNNIDSLMERLKKTLLDNLVKHYQVQSLHRIATFLWPNFRLLKMLTIDEQKDVHEDVRKLIQSRIQTTKTNSDSNDIENRKLSTNEIMINGGCLSDNQNSKSRSDFDEWEIFSDQDQDEVDKYLSVQLTSCSEHFVLNWWREHSQEFPKLSQLAKWVLAIPASVTTRERFQLTKNRQIDDMLLFLHCNMKTEKFDLYSLKKMNLKNKSSKHNTSKNFNNNNSSLIAN